MIINGHSHDDRGSSLPYRDSIYNMIVRRIRAANTIFSDRVKLVLRQEDREHWTALPRPYLLVIPTQSRAPRKYDVDNMVFLNPHDVTLVAQFDDRNSEGSYLAASDIETAEDQLVYVLAMWKPQGYEPTLYGGMRIQDTRAPDVKVSFLFTMQEWKIIRQSPEFGEICDEQPLQVRFDIHVNDPCCNLPCEIIPPLSAEWLISGGGCGRCEPFDPCPPPDPCSPLPGAIP